MPPRVAYWTSAFEPEMEAVAAEVALLRSRFRSSIAWGINPNHWLLLSRRRGYCFHPNLHLLFRLATRIVEPAFQLNHVFGSLGDWYYLQGKRHRPTILTVATNESPVETKLIMRIDRFVVESPAARKEVEALGVASDRIRLIFPPVDLERYTPSDPPSGHFTVLFASSPDREDWLAARGVPLLLDAAALRPSIRFKLLWRPWGNSERRVRQWITDRRLSNVELLSGRISDMSGHYRDAHVTVAPFVDSTRCKSSPNSLIESLACGRPVLATKAVSLADLILEADAGLVSEPSGEALAENLDRLQANWSRLARNAANLAQRCFGIKRFLNGYQAIYDELIAN